MWMTNICKRNNNRSNSIIMTDLDKLNKKVKEIINNLPIQTTILDDTIFEYQRFPYSDDSVDSIYYPKHKDDGPIDLTDWKIIWKEIDKLTNKKNVGKDVKLGENTYKFKGYGNEEQGLVSAYIENSGQLSYSSIVIPGPYKAFQKMWDTCLPEIIDSIGSFDLLDEPSWTWIPGLINPVYNSETGTYMFVMDLVSSSGDNLSFIPVVTINGQDKIIDTGVQDFGKIESINFVEEPKDFPKDNIVQIHISQELAQELIGSYFGQLTT